MSSRPAAPDPVRQLVDVGGYRLHLACQGEGSPTVVMEAAIGETGLPWSLVQPAVAQRSRACVYDRAGLGWSDPSPGCGPPRSWSRSCTPCFLPPSSLGPMCWSATPSEGCWFALYAARHPQEVAGLVLVDSAQRPVPAGPSEIR